MTYSIKHSEGKTFLVDEGGKYIMNQVSRLRQRRFYWRMNVSRMSVLAGDKKPLEESH